VNGPEVEQLPEEGLDLSPRTPAPAVRPRRRRRWAPIAVLVVVLAAGAFILTKFLGNALDYYCNADEVGVKSQCSGDKSLRVQGTVEKGSIVQTPTETRFVIAFNGAAIPVVYDGDPGGKFDECIPVVVRGRLQEGVFQGNEVEVKHSNEYVAKNSDRISEAEASCPSAAA
jgi:cytochrome c-type biogenesis protein CcmE